MKRLVTEADLRRLQPGARVAVDRDTLITPSARDYALQFGIEFAAAAAATAPRSTCCAACSSGSPCGGPACTPQDGDWFVEVRNGRAQWRRISP